MWRPAAFQALAARSSCSPPEADRRTFLSPLPKDPMDSPEAWRHMASACSAPFLQWYSSADKVLLRKTLALRVCIPTHRDHLRQLRTTQGSLTFMRMGPRWYQHAPDDASKEWSS